MAYWYLDSTKYAAVTAWLSGGSVAAAALRRQLATPTVNNERVFVALSAGTTGGSEPSWNLTYGATTSDNGITWQECTGQPGINGDLTNCPNWASIKNTTVTQGLIIKDAAADTLFIASTGGAAGNGSEPTWNKTAGATTTDNAVTWTSLGAVGNFAAFAAPHARLANAMASGWANQSGGDTVFAGNGHAETQASAMTLTFPGSGALPTYVVCVSNASAPPTSATTGASISTTGNNSQAVGGYAYTYGVAFNSSTGFPGSGLFGNSVNVCMVFDTCVFNNPSTASNYTTLPGTQSNRDNLVKCVNTSFVFGASGQQIHAQNGTLELVNCTFAATGTVPSALFGFSGSAQVVIRDSDLSAINTALCSALVSSQGAGSSLLIMNSKLNASVSNFSGSLTSVGGVTIRVHNCDSAGTNYKFNEQNFAGSIKQEVTVVRTGGASNGTINESWNITTTSGSSFAFPFISPDYAQWNTLTGASHTATVYLASNTTLTNGDAWFSLEYPGDSGDPKGLVVSSRKTDILQANVALTSDTSTWGGSPTNVYKITVSFTPQQAGPLKFRFYVAKPSVTVYVDPLLVIS